MRWGESVTLEFVKIYLNHDCLWNPEHAGYKLRYEREKAYIAIASEFKAATLKSLNSQEVKLKIKNLRTTYAQQVHKILEKSSPDCIYEPSLIWFHEMDRCLKNVSSRQSSVSNIIQTVQEAPEVDSSCQIWVDMDQQMPDESSVQTQPDPFVMQIEDNEDSNPRETVSKSKKERKSLPQTLKKIKKKKSKHRSPIREYLTDSNSESHQPTESHHNEDEFDIYGKYIASQLRKIDLHKALRLQLQIQSLVSEARLSK